VSTLGYRLIRMYIAEKGRTTAGGMVVAACQLCDNETPVDRMVTTMHADELLVVCRSCGNEYRDR